MDLADFLVHRIDEVRSDQARFTVGIDGPDGAGKTTLAKALIARLGQEGLHASLDDFQRRKADRHRRGRLSAAGYYRDAFDHDTVVSELLLPFRAGASTVRVASMDYDTDRAVTTTAKVPRKCILVVDGVFLQTPQLRPLWGLVVYLHVAPELSRDRGMTRDASRGDPIDELADRYRERYLPGQAMYRADVDPQATADIVVDLTDLANPVVVRSG